MRRAGFILAACLAMALIVLVSTRGLRNQDTPNEVTIFAASSLADVIQEILRDAPEDIIVRTSFASTSNLVRQIEAGADADIFISANALWMKELRDLGYGVGAVDVFAHNRLVVLAPDNTPLKPAPVVTLFQDPRVQRIALGDPASVPLGKYSRYALVSLDLWSELEVRTVIYGHSATTVLQWVDRGEVDLAVTYASDIHRANHATVLATIPANHHLAITYWQLRLTNTPAAREIEQLLTSPRAKALLSERGFHS